jgi:hypothetical protein
MTVQVAKYDWSMWDKHSIAQMVGESKHICVDQILTVNEFHDKITKHIKKYMPIRSRKSRELEVDKGRVWVGGVYHTEYDMNRKKSIELCLAYHPGDRFLVMTTRRFNRFCARIADVILHEVIHMRQARKRNFKDLPGYSSTAESTKQRKNQEYLGDSDEIDAYAFNMACELDEKFGGNMRQIVNYLNEEQKGKRRQYDTWRTYLKAFDYDQNHKIIRRIKKRSIYYLSRSQCVKPFQSKDWINR